MFWCGQVGFLPWSRSFPTVFLKPRRVLKVLCTEVWTRTRNCSWSPIQYDQLFPLWCASCNATFRYFKVICSNDPTSQAVNGQRPGWHSSSCPFVVANDAPANLAVLAIANMEMKARPKCMNVRASYIFFGWLIYRLYINLSICIVNLAVSRSVRPSRQSQVKKCF